MGIDPVTVAIAGVVMQGVGMLNQRDAAEDQQRAQQDMAAARERQFAAEKQRAEVQNVRSVRQQIRAQRAAAGAIVARGAGSGTLFSSGVQGGVGSTQSQMAGNLNYMSDIADTQTAYGQGSQMMGQAQLAYGLAQGDMARAQAFSALGGTIFSQAGGITAFGAKPPTNTMSPPKTA